MIPNIEDLFEKQNPQDGKLPKWAKELAIKFAGLHVSAALGNGSKSKFKSSIGENMVEHTSNAKNAILNSYPLSNIK